MKALLGIQAADTYLYDWPELGTADPEEAALQRLRGDVRGVHDRFPVETYRRNRERPPHSDYIDDWGSGAKEIEDGVWFPGIHPLAEEHAIEALERYPWPDMNDPARVSGVSERARRLAEENQYAILATPWLLFPLERAFAMQGMDKFLLNLALYPEFAQALLRKNAELCKTLMGHFLDALGENVDLIKIGDDLDTQESLLISPKMYRQMLKPVHADYIAFIKERTKAKVFFHTDGDVFHLITDFIEIGVDVLNPIQTSAGKMADLAELKRRYGKRIVFCGGSIRSASCPTARRKRYSKRYGALPAFWGKAEVTCWQPYTPLTRCRRRISWRWSTPSHLIHKTERPVHPAVLFSLAFFFVWHAFRGRRLAATNHPRQHHHCGDVRGHQQELRGDLDAQDG